jgi:hypothetical protein
MSNLRKLEFKSDVKEALQSMLDQADRFDSVCIVAATKEDGQLNVEFSTTSGYQKAWLVTGLQAWFHRWFLEP